VCNRNDESPQILEMTIKRGCLFEVLEFDHVPIVAVGVLWCGGRYAKRGGERED